MEGGPELRPAGYNGRDVPGDDVRQDSELPETIDVSGTESERDPDDDAGSAPRILARPEHPISRKLISEGAVKVLYRLKKAGYKGYMCGGAVRDLMLEGRPKDFDVCTDAEPRDLRRLFRNARIIGRRFRLAHVIFRDGIVEVSTFRRTPDPDEQLGGPEDLLITSDNAFGTPREDAFRRDFTVNALFYNIADFSVIDYVGGVEDLENGLIRVIGDPDLRFREDPVRMLRACEFAGRLGFTIETGTQEAIQRHGEDLRRAAAPRLTEELQQLLRSGSAGAAMQWMLDLDLLDVLLPEAQAMIAAAERGAGDFGGILPTLDRMATEDREVSDVVLLASVLLPQIMLRRFEVERDTGRWMKVPRYLEIVHETLDSFLERFTLANFKRTHLIHVLEGFHRLCSQDWTPGPAGALRLEEHLRRRLAAVRDPGARDRRRAARLESLGGRPPPAPAPAAAPRRRQPPSPPPSPSAAAGAGRDASPSRVRGERAARPGFRCHLTSEAAILPRGARANWLRVIRWKERGASERGNFDGPREDRRSRLAYTQVNRL